MGTSVYSRSRAGFGHNFRTSCSAGFLRRAVILILMATCFDLAGIRWQVARAADRPLSLLLYPTATDVISEADRLRYSVEVNFPASELIAWISHGMKRLGWKPVRTSSSHFRRKWVNVSVSRHSDDELRSRTWQGSWKDSKGNVTTYSLWYDESKLTIVTVAAVYYAAAAYREDQQIQREFENPAK